VEIFEKAYPSAAASSAESNPSRSNPLKASPVVVSNRVLQSTANGPVKGGSSYRGLVFASGEMAIILLMRMPIYNIDNATTIKRQQRRSFPITTQPFIHTIQTLAATTRL
jgi:hypothetical protein